MAAKRPRKAESKAAGPRGPRGKVGPTGPAGPTNGEGANLSAQMSEVVKELETQLTRIAQIQLQLDRLAAGESPQSDRRASKRVSH